MLAAAIFLTFVLIFYGTAMSFAFKVILGFIGSTSFWVMFITFISMTFFFVREK
jgi:hypothetical protein